MHAINCRYVLECCLIVALGVTVSTRSSKSVSCDTICYPQGEQQFLLLLLLLLYKKDATGFWYRVVSNARKVPQKTTYSRRNRVYRGKYSDSF